MLTTICLNPCFDRTIHLDHLNCGGTNHVLSSRTDPGGKAINVALDAKNLEMDVQCIWCAPEDGGKRFGRQLDDHGLKHVPLAVPGTLRTNTKLIAPDQPDTEINESGAWLDEETFSAVLDACIAHANGSTLLALTGSLPGGCPPDTYTRLIRAINVPTVLDTSGAALLAGLAAQPLLVKPNLEELSRAMNLPLQSDADIASAARQLMELGAQNVLVSMGKQGAMLFTPQCAYKAAALDVPVQSTVGAGDAMVAGVLYSLSQGNDMKEAFRSAIAAGSAAVGTEGTQPFDKATYLTLLDKVQLQEVDM